MLDIKKEYIVNSRKQPVGVVLDLKTFEQIEDILEDYLFGRILTKAAKKKPISLEEAKRRYNGLKSKPAKKSK